MKMLFSILLLFLLFLLFVGIFFLTITVRIKEA